MPRTSCKRGQAARVAAVGGLNRFGPGLSGYRSTVVHVGGSVPTTRRQDAVRS